MIFLEYFCIKYSIRNYLLRIELNLTQLSIKFRNLVSQKQIKIDFGQDKNLI
jgi:hypothetical protein